MNWRVPSQAPTDKGKLTEGSAAGNFFAEIHGLVYPQGENQEERRNNELRGDEKGRHERFPGWRH